jgi:hypothetical protein
LAAFGRGPFSNHLLNGMAAEPFPNPVMDFPTTVPAVHEFDTDASGTAAAEQIVRSYHHRLGRPPTLDELRAALGLEADEPIRFRAPEPASYAQPSQPASSTAAEEVIRSYRNRLGRPPSMDELRASLGLETDLEAPDAGTAPGGDAGWGLIGGAQARSFDPKDPRAPKAIVMPLPGGGGLAPLASRETSPEPPAPWHRWQVVPEALGRSLHLGLGLPEIAGRRMIEWLKGEEIDDAYGRWLKDRSDATLRAQAQAWDYWRSDPKRSYQTYTKEREDLGECRYSQKTDPRLPCYYAGSTSGESSAMENVWRRDEAKYPTDSYRRPVLDCSTASYMAARAREQQAIDFYRSLGVSDNIANAIADNLWGPYFREMAEQQCGSKGLPVPQRR